MHKSKWIWLNGEAQADSYGEFYTSFLYQSGSCELRISADSDYTVFINGRFVQSGQYRDFPYEKVYDRFNVTEHLIPGENHIAIVVWYYGLPNSSYYPGPAGLWFEIRNGEVCAECSGTHTLSRLSCAYRNGRKKKITAQLGLSYSYDATQEDGWKNGVLSGFSESRADERPAPAVERPVKKLTVDHRAESKLIRSGNGVYLFDLGREEVGYLTLCVKSAIRQTLTVAWGEHITDGGVRRLVGGRDFSSELTVGEGITEYTNYFRRLGLRYLELHAEQALRVEYVSVLPCRYPLKRIPADFGDPLKNRIYQTAVRTLELCMHDHYEDCPWREQAMYAMDGRNQMLCGYYAFGEFDFPRACLLLMSKDRRSDGLLSICTPDSTDLTIPSFSLHYFTEIYEYTVYSGDLTLARALLPKLISIMEAFLSRMQDGLVPVFSEKCHWNFYEWTEGLAGNLQNGEPLCTEAALNCLLSIALERMQWLCEQLEAAFDYGEIRAKLNRRITEVFYDAEKGLYINRTGERCYSELVNSLAILCGAADRKTAEQIADRLAGENEMTEVSLSMVCFKYDALFRVNKETYRGYILEHIGKKYKMMLDAGATSFWETERGERDFGGAGSLCHGWSAMPVYYYHILAKQF